MEFEYFSQEQSDAYAFYRIPKMMITDESFAGLSTDAKMLYGLLLDRVSLSKQNGWLDESGRVYIYFTLDNVMEALDCGNSKACSLLKELDDFGLIERRKQGLGQPTIIYVKDFARLRKTEVQTSENQNSRVPKSRSQDFRKTETNNTKDNNTDINNTNPIQSGENYTDRDMRMNTYRNRNLDDKLDICDKTGKTTNWDTDKDTDEGMDKGENMVAERNSYARILSKHMEIDVLKERYPYDKETLDSIWEMVLDVVCSKRKIIRIAGDDKPVNVVKSHFLKLDSSHIEYVLGCLNENRSHIRNIKQYMLTMLYNAPITMHSYFQAMVSSNMAERKNSQNH